MTTFQNRLHQAILLMGMLLFLMPSSLKAQINACPEGDIFSYPDFSNSSNIYMYNGTKKSNNTIQLTTNINDVGLLYGITKFPVQEGFSSTFSFRLDKAIGEGFSLMIHPNYAIYNLSQASGAGLGYNGIRRNVAIEFDTQQSEGETNDNHISIQTNGMGANKSHPDFSLATQEVTTDLNDGEIHFAKIRYINGQLAVFLDDFEVPVISAALDLATLLDLDDSGAYLVFTGASGITAAKQNINCWSTQTETDNTCVDVIIEAAVTLIEPTTCGTSTGQALIVFSGSGSGIGGNYTYQWSNGEILQEAFELPAGLNTVTITDEAGCSKELSIDIPGPDQLVGANFNYEIGESSITFTDLSTGPITNQIWSGNLPNSIANNSVILPPNGRYEVCLTVENECGTSNTFCKTINIGLLPTEPACIDGDLFTYSDFSTTSRLYLFGDVQKKDEVIQLTGGTADELSTLYGIHKINMETEFQTNFTFQIDDQAEVAEGFALMIHPNFAIYNQAQASGAGLGYNGVSKSIAIEFDVQADVDGLAAQHVAIHSKGTRPNSSAADGMLAGAILPFALNDGQVHNARIVYSNQQLSVFIDNFEQALVQTNIDIPAQLSLGNKEAYLVFTAATSTSGATQNILCWSANATAPIIEEVPEKVVFQSAAIEGESGATISIPIKAKNFQDILGLQTALQFSETIGQITGFSDFNLAGLTASNFTIDNQHQFSIVWESENPVSVTDETTLFSVDIQLAETTNRICSQLEENTQGIATQITHLGANKMDAEFNFNEICVEPKEVVTPSGLAFTSEDASGTPGQLIQVPIRVNDFKDIVSMQKTIRLAQSGIGRIVGTSNYGLSELSADNFNFINDTLITLVWFQATPTTLPDDSIIYTLDILLMDTENATCVELIIDDSRTFIEVADKDLNILDYEILTGDICVEIPVSEAVFISGTIETEIGQPLRNVKINCPATETVKSNDLGFYQFENLSPDTNYELIPEKTNNPLQRVSTLDLVIIMKHILDKERLDSPYKMLAADVNQDGRISSVDLVITRQLILNIRTVFPNELSWLFVPKAYQFPPNEMPNINDVPQSITLLDTDGRYINQDFIGVKMGDVSYKLVDGFNEEVAEARNTPLTLPFTLKNQFFEKGELVEATISTANFAQLLGYQLALTFNPAILEFQQLTPSDQQTNLVFNAAQSENGVLPILWYATDNPTTEFTDNKATQLFQLTFKAKAAGNLADLLAITQRFLPVEAVLTGNAITDIALNFETSVDLPTTFQVTKIYPNPATQTAWLAIDNPIAQAATIQVLNVHGQLLLEQSTMLTAGPQKIMLPLGNLDNGLYYVAVKDNLGSPQEFHKLLVVNK